MNEDRYGQQFWVALRKESVDRNIRSLAWGLTGGVALRKESVDRNYIIKITRITPTASLSARRAWIEILSALKLIARQNVALRKESVDRNFNAVQIEIVKMCRSPQGERG